jgi:type IV secretory pathway TrbL component
MELEVWQILLIGVIASILTQAIRLIAARFGNSKIPREVVSWIAAVVSLALAGLWLAPSVPRLEDPMDFLNLLINQASAIVGFAFLIYNVLLARLIEKLGLSIEEALTKYNQREAV